MDPACAEGCGMTMRLNTLKNSARTWKRYVVAAVRPLVVNDAVVEVPTTANVPPLAPGARRMS